MEPARPRAVPALHAVDLENPKIKEYVTWSASWVFMSRSEERIAALAQAALERAAARPRRVPPVVWPSRERIARAPLWTDEYSNLFRVLR